MGFIAFSVVIGIVLAADLYAFRLQNVIVPTFRKLINHKTNTGPHNSISDVHGHGSKRLAPGLHAYGSGNGGGGFRGGGGRPSWGSKPKMDPRLNLAFKKTIKIDPELKTPITDMKFLPETLSVLKDKGFEFMTPVQSQSYDLVYSGDDVVARSRTGTGKTFAFGIPLIEKIVRSGDMDKFASRRGTGGSPSPLVLVLEPTRELAIQVTQELSSICAQYGMRVQTIYGGASFEMQANAIRHGAHILVATPGRMLDHISRGTVDLSGTKHIVLDEGDTMLEMGFQKAVESIIRNVKSPGEDSRRAAAGALDDSGDEAGDDYDPQSDAAVQMLLFSATMPGWIRQLTDKHMNDPVFLDAVQDHETRLADTITHYAMRLPHQQSLDSVLESLITTKGAGGQTIIFTNTKHDADALATSSGLGQLNTQVLHGDISQSSRQNTIKAFKAGTVDVLVATDVAARGLDIAGVDLVLHIAPPLDADTYVHRAGRTGRAGRAGTSIVLCDNSNEFRLGSFERLLKFSFRHMEPPSAMQLSQSSATFAVNKLKKVDDRVVPLFLAAARELLAETSAQAGESEEIGDGEGARHSLEVLLAKCLATISNKAKVAAPSASASFDRRGGGGGGGFGGGGGRGGGGGSRFGGGGSNGASNRFGDRGGRNPSVGWEQQQPPAVRRWERPAGGSSAGVRGARPWE